MRFLFRAFGGLILLVLAAALLGVASIKLKNAFSEKAKGSFKTKYANERVYTASVQRLEPIQINPKIMATAEYPALIPVLSELFLAIIGMALLIFGVFQIAVSSHVKMCRAPIVSL